MGHWYLPSGEPFYTIKGLSGKERDVTLRDARKVNAVVSVTTILGLLSKPQLDIWKLNQILLAVTKDYCFNEVNESFDDYKKRVYRQYKLETEKYSIEGTRIHNALELYNTEGTIEPHNEVIVCAAYDLLKNVYGADVVYESEVGFAHKDGFGGKMDLVINTPDGKVIIDFKTKQTDEPSSKNCYFDYCMQLAAYKKAFKDDSVLLCGNLLISTTNPGKVYLHVWSDSDIDKATKMFYNLLNYWKLSNNYDPEI